MCRVEQAWAGIDAGKEHHHVVVIDGEGRRVLSRRVLNDEPEVGKLIDAVVDQAHAVTWAVDLADGPAALMITLLVEHGHRLLFLPGSPSIAPLALTAAKARQTPRTPRSSPTRRGCDVTCANCSSRTR